MSYDEPHVAHTAAPRNQRKKVLVWAFQMLMTLVVLAFVVRQLQFALNELKTRNVSLAEINWHWLGLGGVLYFASLLPAASFWRQALLGLGNRPTVWRAYRAFLIGGVGKYIPGKAAVVFLRTVLVAGPHCTAASAGVAVFIETLTMMGVGGFLAAIVVTLLFRDQWLIAALSASLAIAVILPTIPRVTRKVAQVIRLQKLSGDILVRLEGWNVSLIVRGWVLESANWILQTFSVWVCLRALPQSFFENPQHFASAQGLSQAFPLLLVSTALSTVVGFLLLIPAGLGVREILVLNMLAPAIGHPAATTVSVLSRVVMILMDVLIAAVLYPIPSSDLAPENPSS